MSIGGNITIEKGKTICGGNYNTTEGKMVKLLNTIYSFNSYLKGLEVYQNMSQCKKNIDEKCEVSLTNEDATAIQKCYSGVEEFERRIETCKDDNTNCSCWASLALTISNVLACNGGDKNILEGKDNLRSYMQLNINV